MTENTRTFLVEGRGMHYKRCPRARVYTDLRRWDMPVFDLTQAFLDERREQNEFRLIVCHYDATDFEHDSSKVFVLEGTGLTYMATHGPRVEFSGVAMKVYMYPAGFEAIEGATLPEGHEHEGDDTIYKCDYDRCPDPGHLMMPFYPPKIKWTPRQITFELDFAAKKHKRTNVLTTIVEKEEDAA